MTTSGWQETSSDSSMMRMYVSAPATGRAVPALVVMQHQGGVDEFVQRATVRLAEAGFVAVAPDLFWRIKPGIDLTDQTDAEWQEAFGYMNALDKNASVKDVAASLAWARSQGVCKAGVMGYCMGGYIAFLAACRTDTDATVAYHGGGIHTALGEAGGIKKPLMLHNPMKDGFIPVEALNTIRETLASNPLVTVHEYAEQDHAFTREGGKHYDADATKLADGRTIAFFNANLA